jgi:hypothetical protein
MSYKIFVKTADEKGAGTDSNLFLRLFGAKGQSNEIRMNSRVKGNAFERNDMNVFKVDEDLGPIYEISLKSDKMYSGADWRPDYIRVEGKEQSTKFVIGHWIRDTKTYTFTAPEYKLTKLGSGGSFRVAVTFVQLIHNQDDAPMISEKKTVTFQRIQLQRAVEEFESSTTSRTTGVSVEHEMGASLPIKGVELETKLKIGMTSEKSRQAHDSVKTNYSLVEERSVETTELTREEIPPHTYRVTLLTRAFEIEKLVFSDGFGAEIIYALTGQSGLETKSRWSFNDDTKTTMTNAEFEMVRDAYVREQGSEVQLLELENFEEEARRKGWIKG